MRFSGLWSLGKNDFGPLLEPNQCQKIPERKLEVKVAKSYRINVFLQLCFPISPNDLDIPNKRKLSGYLENFAK